MTSFLLKNFQKFCLETDVKFEGAYISAIQHATNKFNVSTWDISSLNLGVVNSSQTYGR
jgi:hypothetical protein